VIAVIQGFKGYIDKVAYLGHVVGQGYIKAVKAKLKSVTKYSIPEYW